MGFQALAIIQDQGQGFPFTFKDKMFCIFRKFLQQLVKMPEGFDGISIDGMNNKVAELRITGIDRSRKNPGNQHHLLTPGMGFLDFSVPVFVG